MDLDTKRQRPEEAPEAPREKKPNMVFRYTVATCFLLLWLLAYTLYVTFIDPSTRLGRTFPSSGKPQRTDFELPDIKASEHLEWHPCYSGHLCARLTVPRDYHRPLSASSANPKVHIALIMRPGRGHIETGNFSTSPLLINPGGPGGPGTYALLGFGGHLQQVVGEDRDIIGFDPRGIGFTTPLADCFTFPANGRQPKQNETRQGAQNRLMWLISRSTTGLVGVTDSALRKIDEGNRAYNTLCKQRDDIEGSDSILRHVDTPMVARDMISIIDAWDAWRDKNTKCKHSRSKTQENTSVESTKGKLVYWGFSYGTLLGATFAAMFPDRVGRMILDGVVDADHYVNPIWDKSIESDDAILDKFHHYCHAAGPKCALYRSGDKEEDIRNRFHGIMDSLRNESIASADPNFHIPLVIDYSALKSLIFSILYSPIMGFPALAGLLARIENGKWVDVAESLNNMLATPIPMGDAQRAIMCSDKRYHFNDTLPQLEARFQNLTELSSFADVWMSVMIQCNFWAVDAVDPPMRWDDHPAHKPKPINTSYPLMFISNTLDPVTPLNAGIVMARKFVGAGLLEQTSEGHCSLNAVSLCTILAARLYIREGIVPPQPGRDGAKLKCEPNEWPWRRYEDTSYGARMYEEEAFHAQTLDGVRSERAATIEEAKLLESWYALQEKASDWNWFGKPRFAGL